LAKIVENAGHFRPWLNPLLRDAMTATSEDSQERLNISLALLPDDPAQVAYLYPRMLKAEPSNVIVLINDLSEHKEELKSKLWEVAERSDSGATEHLRAAAALAKYDPSSLKWSGINKRVVGELVRDPVNLGSWLDAFAPVKNHLIKPILEILREPLPAPTGDDPIAAERVKALAIAERAARRDIASNLLLKYASNDPHVFTEALLESDENQFPKFLNALKNRNESNLYLLTEIQRKLNEIDDPDLKERVANRMANAAVYLVMLNSPESIWNLMRLKSGDDPRVRSYVISRLGRLGADPRVLAARLGADGKASPGQTEKDVTVRRALVQALGMFPEQSLTKEYRRVLEPKIKEVYLNEPDAGLHSSAEWLLREWGLDDWLLTTTRAWSKDAQHQARDKSIMSSFLGSFERPVPQWFVNGAGHTMIAIPGKIEFVMGSPPSELGHLTSEKQHAKRINRSFAIASNLTTLAQFDRFDKGAHSRDLPREFRDHPNKPVVRATWYQVAKYCNWLSDQEGLPRCYKEEDGNVVGVEENYLDLTGYRLPTEAEVAYANRANTSTCRFYGETEDLLGEYAWYQKNSGEVTHVVGTRKPNDFGLFDMQGNAFTWCHDRVSDRLHNTDDVSDSEPRVDATQKRVLRGGAFYFMAISLRAARRHDDVPTMQGLYYSFRVARTLK
jgi:formylglycine-generating enzyme required for sulfatase activity